jgi:TRAP-type C4-dicarboxylate transport system permease small subunit
MRTFLDSLYRVALWLSALCLIVIGLMVGLQLAGRIYDGLLKLAGFPPYGFVILSLAEIAGFLLASASFLALAATLRSGVHIRVTMALAALSEGTRRYVELWAFGASALFCIYMTWSIGRFAWVSYRFHEVSFGLIPVPLAIPQAAMTVGILLLAVALIDEFVTVLRRGRPSFRQAEDAHIIGKES